LPGLDLEPWRFVNYLENHDQVANSAFGRRVHQMTSPGRYRALKALLLLSPGTPMLFQGEEFAASSPFLYFVDHNSELNKLVREGRKQFLGQFKTVATEAVSSRLHDPAERAVFERCKLDLSERQSHAEFYALHKDLLRMRREHAAFSAQRPRAVDGAVLSDNCLALRFFGEHSTEDRLLVVNLGRDLHLGPMPEPLLSAPLRNSWHMIWSSEDPRYGGQGTPEFREDSRWHLLGESAVVLAPEEAPEKPVQLRDVALARRKSE
jgi:maltooligosyltrehalose trehalohydrolase